MAFIIIFKEVNKEVIKELNLTEHEEGYQGVWHAHIMENMLVDIKNRLASGEEGYVLYVSNGDTPQLISKIHSIFSNEEFKKFNKERDKPFNAPKGFEDATVRFEKDYQFVHPNIVDYISSGFEQANGVQISFFDRSSYESFLEENGIVYQKLNFNLKFNREQFLSETFIADKTIKRINSSLKYKKNIILQGPPGVGKTFIAKKLAYLSMIYRDSKRVQMIQFHQSYSYEDFIQGYKPEEGGGFKLKNSIFYDFCKRAQSDPTYPYFFIIDEINRGNLSKIFGELMMLLEADKRGPEFAIPLTYSKGGETFYIPENLYLIGLMNTADRSLAVVDYALRRRFAFINMEPILDGKFNNFLQKKGISKELTLFISTKIKELNEVIEHDPNLGKGFLIGHSYFCSNIDVEDSISWYNQIVENEIGPILEEYWYDEPIKAVEETNKLHYKGN